MSQEQFLSEEECAALAAVSIETIRQYAAFGLLKGEEFDGRRRYRAADLELLFGKSITRGPEPKVQTAPNSPTPGSTEKPLEKKVDQHSGPGTAQQPSEPVAGANGSGPSREVIELSPSPAAPPASFEQYHLLEMNRALRDQIEHLRDERDWLRTRLEKLETRSEREQMLVISESETIRSFISQQQKRRSFWSFALPWLREKN